MLPRRPYRRVCYHIVFHIAFKITIYILIIANLALLAYETFGIQEGQVNIKHILYYVFIVIYVIFLLEFIMTIFAYSWIYIKFGIKTYFA